MASKSVSWLSTPVEDGVMTVTLGNWGRFDDYIRGEMLDYRNFIWRGQCAAKWALESSLDRTLRKLGKLKDSKIRAAHLHRFVLSTRGRRGFNPPNMSSENDWWALGQHYGLATPLLDWTTSPYVAAYFAFLPEDNDGEPNRAVYALSRTAVERRSKVIAKSWKGKKGRPPIVELVEPHSDENARLVNQGGLFTRGPDGVTLDDWVRDNFKGETTWIRIIKIQIPDLERTTALRSLNRMNINHLSLFPDVYGAAKYANVDLRIDKY